MPGKRIAIIQGHPDPSPQRFCRALADAYRRGAESAGHQVRTIDVAGMEFPLLHDREDWEKGTPPEAVREAQATIAWAQHVVIVFPLWLGDMPAQLKAFLEQALRPNFAFRYKRNGIPARLMSGRSARVIVTMGMPAFFYEIVYRAHSVKSLERNILRFTGFAPVERSILGPVEGGDSRRRESWLGKVEALGQAAR